MFDLMGSPLLVLTATAAVAAVVGAVLLAVRRDGGRPRLLRRGVPVTVLVLLAQTLAVGAFAFAVNDHYAFYTSWADVTGRVSQGTAIATNGLVRPGEGHLKVVTLRKHPGSTDDQVMVWTPPQYDEASYRSRKLPVVMFLPGQPSSPQIVFHQFRFAKVATQEISSGQVPPFVAVFPTLMIAPPRDTECTNVPHGPQAESWLTREVPAYVASHFRVAPPGAAWTAMGWSTGGFCATKVVMTDPRLFGSAASFGGYYQSIEDNTTGNLFGGQARLQRKNSPVWLYGHHGGMRGDRLLLVAGEQDHETWRSTYQMIQAAAGDPSVSHVAFPQGGHNYHNYAAYLGPALRWSARSWPA